MKALTKKTAPLPHQTPFKNSAFYHGLCCWALPVRMKNTKDFLLIGDVFWENRDRFFFIRLVQRPLRLVGFAGCEFTSQWIWSLPQNWRHVDISQMQPVRTKLHSKRCHFITKLLTELCVVTNFMIQEFQLETFYCITLLILLNLSVCHQLKLRR